MSMFNHKEISTEEVHAIIQEVGEDLQKYGAQRVRERWERHYNLNAWLGFFVCLIPIISIILFFTIPVFPAVVITVAMVAFILAIILNT